jgi:hypothetical protein
VLTVEMFFVEGEWNGAWWILKKGVPQTPGLLAAGHEVYTAGLGGRQAALH